MAESCSWRYHQNEEQPICCCTHILVNCLLRHESPQYQFMIKNQFCSSLQGSQGQNLVFVINNWKQNCSTSVVLSCKRMPSSMILVWHVSLSWPVCSVSNLCAPLEACYNHRTTLSFTVIRTKLSKCGCFALFTEYFVCLQNMVCSHTGRKKYVAILKKLSLHWC